MVVYACHPDAKTHRTASAAQAQKKPLAQFTRIGFGAKCAIILIPAPLPLITARLIKRDQNGLSKKWMAEHDAARHKILN